MAKISRFSLVAGVVLVLLSCVASEDYVDKFVVCRQLFLGIIDGNKTHGDINNVTIWERPFLYTGPVQGPDPSYSRADILTPTYEGEHCAAACGRQRKKTQLIQSK